MNVAALPAYQAMKDSDVDWLEQIPAEWDVRKLKFVVKILKRIAGREGPDVLSITQQGIKVKDIESGEGQLAQDYSGYQIVDRGDFAMNHMDLLTGYVDISQFDGVVSPDYRVFQNHSDEVLDEYLLLIFQIGYTQKIFFRYGQGVSLLGRWRFPADNFNEFRIPIPPKDQQQKIVEFINAKTAKIDEAVRIKEEQIALLRERRQILIQNAVTRGLNPDAHMKDSGIDWIGQIPEHWEVKKAAWYFKAKKGSDAARLTREFCGTIEGPYSVFSGQTENGGILGLIDRYEFDFSENGCMLCSTVGAKAMTIRYLKEKFSLSQNCMIIVPIDADTSMEYFSYGFAPVFAHFRNLIPDHMQASFRMEDFYEMRFLLPPRAEQSEILTEIKRATLKIDNAIELKQSQIAALKEYKASLINSAVTGKIKVV